PTGTAANASARTRTAAAAPSGSCCCSSPRSGGRERVFVEQVLAEDPALPVTRDQESGTVAGAPALRGHRVEEDAVRVREALPASVLEEDFEPGDIAAGLPPEHGQYLPFDPKPQRDDFRQPASL